MTCRASAIGIEGKQPQNNFLESLLAICKDHDNEHRLERKNRAWAASVQDLCPLVESVKSVAAEKTDFPFSPEVARLIESCETLPQSAFTICDAAANLLLDGLKAHELALNYFRDNESKKALEELAKVKEFANRLHSCFERLNAEVCASRDRCRDAMVAVAKEHGNLNDLNFEKAMLTLRLNIAEDGTNKPELEAIESQLIALEHRITVLDSFDARTIKSFGGIHACLNNLSLDVRFLSKLPENPEIIKPYLEEEMEEEFYSEWRSSYLNWRCAADANKIMLAAFKKE